MKQVSKKIALGFTEQQFDQGAHICQIYTDEKEREDTLVQYLISGLHSHECTTCFSEKENEDHLSIHFKKKGIDYHLNRENGNISLSAVNDIYFSGNLFIPERMLDLLTNFYTSALKNNYSGARVIGEMTSKVKEVAGGERLMEYESRVSLLQKTYPVTTVCQYDAREFDGATILDILKVHPFMIVKGSVVNNPFYIPPEEFLNLNS